MKTRLLLFMLLAPVCGVFAQTSRKINYQVLIRNNSNQIVSNTAVGMRISILQNSATGKIIYQEIFSPDPVTNKEGIVSIEIGGGVASIGSFSAIDWFEGPYFVKTETDPLGGTNYIIEGISQLLTVMPPASSGTSKSHYIGEFFGGGIIFHVYKDADGNEHGLIVSPVNIGNPVSWSNVISEQIGVSAQSLKDGKANTKAIISQAGHMNSAALICDTSTINGQTDWYLPAENELRLLYEVRIKINQLLVLESDGNGAVSGLLHNATTSYWSSTEKDARNARAIVFSPGYSYNYLDKNNTSYVRAIRAF